MWEGAEGALGPGQGRHRAQTVDGAGPQAAPSGLPGTMVSSAAPAEARLEAGVRAGGGGHGHPLPLQLCLYSRWRQARETPGVTQLLSNSRKLSGG